MAQGNEVGQLAGSLSNAVPNAISVFFNAAAGDVLIEAAIKDILDKLQRGAKLLESEAIAVTVLGEAGAVDLAPTATSHPAPALGGMLEQEVPFYDGDDLPDAPSMSDRGTLSLGQLVSSGASLKNVFAGSDSEPSGTRVLNTASSSHV